ncbi:MAG: hypothetical protein IK096_04275, partial [Lachnospiraceae bacterium]|nr:hypothetical protein [Lachnospiraceae bacterium]
MLEQIPYRRMRLQEVKREGDTLLLRLAKGVQEITPVSAGSVRVRYSYGPLTTDPASKPCIVDLPSFSEWEHEEDETGVLVKLPDLQIRIDRET